MQYFHNVYPNTVLIRWFDQTSVCNRAYEAFPQPAMFVLAM